MAFSIFGTQKLIQPIGKHTRQAGVGDKANSLATLQKLGFLIPKTYTCDWRAYQRFLSGDMEVLDAIRKELGTIIESDKKYAVRSSSNLEDSMQFSFAGQFQSLLNVQSVENITAAIIHVWEEAKSDQLASYIAQHDIQEKNVLMGVIIQEMVEPVWSGVILTRNPVTYTSEVVIEAVAGYGDDLMQRGIDATGWVVKDGSIVSGEKDGTFSAHILTLARDALRVKKTLKMDVDMEWVFDGSDIYYLQSRPISSLSSIKIYSNRISRDMLPGMIKPLVWSVNIPLVNSVWIDILESIVGPLGVQPEDLAHAFFYRTYFNMGIFGEVFKSMGMPPDALETMMGLKEEREGKSAMRPGKEMIRHIPRILRFAFKHLSIGKQIGKELREIEISLNQLDFKAFPKADADALLAQIDAHKPTVKKIAYYNIVAPLLMGFHNRMLKKHLERVGMDFLNFDLMKDHPRSSAYDPNHFIAQLHDQFHLLPVKIQKALLKDAENTLVEMAADDPFRMAVQAFINQFGHFSDSGNDFSYAPWRENLPFIIQMITDFERKQEMEDQSSFEQIETSIIKRLLIRRVYRKAREFRLLRERVSSSYIYGYGLFRYYFLALGDKLAARKVLEGSEDIFYLNEQQIRDAFDGSLTSQAAKEIVSFHKETMREQENITAPELIYGENEPVLDIKSASEFQGVPASAGFYRGPACVVKSRAEFGKVKKGDVLLIPFSDVGWTPIFPKAGAVISESGGMLSHCAIVAREYGIPSVVSALGVMNLKDGQMLTVDANAGVVYTHEEG